MTEAEWLAATDPTGMLEFLRGKASDRKLRLLICAICRRRSDLIELGRYGAGLLDDLLTAERYADDEANDSEREGAHCHARAFNIRGRRELRTLSTLVAESLEPDGFLSPLEAMHRVGGPKPRGFQTAILRCIFGNPFRPVAADPAWLTSAVVGLAVAIYAERAFDRLPVLADALEEAGCDRPDALAHCRGDGPHARGCWVVDLVLGKT